MSLVGRYGWIMSGPHHATRWYCKVVEEHSSGKAVKVVFGNPRAHPKWVETNSFYPHEEVTQETA